MSDELQLACTRAFNKWRYNPSKTIKAFFEDELSPICDTKDKRIAELEREVAGLRDLAERAMLSAKPVLKWDIHEELERAKNGP